MSICQCCDPGAAAARDAAEAADPTPALGLEPSDPDCRCRLCDPPPEGSLDPVDARTVRKVWRYGWQVVAVSGGPGPDFAYTVGLPHRAGHPELLMSGLDCGLMHHCLDHLAEQVLDGEAYRPGQVLEGVLSGGPVLLEPVRTTALADTVVCSRRFHRRRTPALQVVWPDAAARFGWQPGVDDEARRRQPASWRVPTGRTGLLAPDPVWPLTTPPDALAVACRHVVEEGAWAAQVERWTDRGGHDVWSVTCSEDHDLDADPFEDPFDDLLDDEPEDAPTDTSVTTHLAHLVRAAPSLAELADLPSGGEAFRTAPDQSWLVIDRRAWSGGVTQRA